MGPSESDLLILAPASIDPMAGSSSCDDALPEKMRSVQQPFGATEKVIYSKDSIRGNDVRHNAIQFNSTGRASIANRAT